MTVKTVDLGGSDWSDNDVLYAADQNDTFGAVTIHRKQFSDATERTTTSSTWEDSSTEFTLSVPVNSLIIGFYLTTQLANTTGTHNMDANVQLSGTSLGTQYLRRVEGTFSGTTYRDGGLTIDTTEGLLLTTNTGNNVYALFSANGFVPLKILDASTTIKLRFRRTSAGEGFLKNVELDVIYVEIFKED